MLYQSNHWNESGMRSGDMWYVHACMSYTDEAIYMCSSTYGLLALYEMSYVGRDVGSTEITRRTIGDGRRGIVPYAIREHIISIPRYT